MSYSIEYLLLLEVANREDPATVGRCFLPNLSYDHQSDANSIVHLSSTVQVSTLYQSNLLDILPKLCVSDQYTVRQTPLPAVCVHLYSNPGSTSSGEPGLSSLMAAQVGCLPPDSVCIVTCDSKRNTAIIRTTVPGNCIMHGSSIF